MESVAHSVLFVLLVVVTVPTQMKIFDCTIYYCENKFYVPSPHPCGLLFSSRSGERGAVLVVVHFHKVR